MKVRIGREELLTGLQRVQGVVEKRNTMPILSNILLEAKHDGAEIVATDLEIGMRGLYKATVLEAGGVTISARKLYEIIKELPSGEIELTSGDNNWTTIQAGKSQFKVVGLPSGDYPALPSIEREGLTPLAGAGLLELIRKTLFAAGDNDARYILNGLLVSLTTTEKKTTLLRLVGTDGHRLAVAEREVGTPNAKQPAQDIKAIIPKKAAQEMRRLLEEGGDEEPLIGFTKNLMIFRKSGLLLTSRLMEGNYPNYQQVVPKESGKRIVVNRGLLESALRRVSVLSKDKANAVKVSFAPGGMTLFSSNPDYGEATEELVARYEGEALNTGFNARYLLDALSVMDGESVSLQMDTALSPCLIQEAESPGFKCVVMPIKI
ncbi:MAG TPA: DNA polymerase III subunit beta [Nitrospira sp.]|jgi:DNA polymerase-3 subunit beta|uniref:DNA polymerase III subunit beta n=1 Tax=Nitrospira sp. ND1 TaxID=1658518 RepID=UPI0009BA51F9|nr:DNA polymerase III subunit beta [Nitrospira sp. ND1]MBK7418354.1 DNA polymerase III subunit beta [Nitrospira sp.]OYT24829.1 MAG: DNA polymerase III subunit beta [Nitrospira sp. UW-LDO-02]MBK7484885.1 DNA polymerase III subunit beta [Nitrospira sp.]MBP6198655.1 DNA polymerase III subunit beta [Nitrospira sp.]MBP6206925.1 DNA polymerase III subunit beta [Nitrospira sp.]